MKTPTELWAEIDAERTRAHEKHGPNSCEGLSAFDLRRLPILTEEVGEVAAELNEGDIRYRQLITGGLRAELVQVAAVAIGWIVAIDREVQ